MSQFEFINGSRDLLNLVQPLWEKLKIHHEINSCYFADNFRNLTFETRKSKLTNDESIIVNIDLIKDLEKDLYVGYCINTVNNDLIGEIDSIFVDKEYRKYGLGDKLMTRALEWLNSNQVKTKIIGVAEGNENVLDFYKRHGFYKRRIILEEINE